VLSAGAEPICFGTNRLLKHRDYSIIIGLQDVRSGTVMRNEISVLHPETQVFTIDRRSISTRHSILGSM
jgi:hypothetical protein